MILPTWFYIAAGAGLFIAGVMEIITNRCYFLSKRKFTEESLKAFAKYDGVCEMAFGIALACLSIPNIGTKICLFLVIGALTFFSFKMQEIVKKKDTHL